MVYTYGDDLISQNRAGASSFYLYDGLGSTRAMSDSAGVVTDGWDYSAFGEVVNRDGGTENNYLFAGEQFDAGLDQYYLRARYYDQGIGRFTQMDTWAGNMHQPITLNKYLYANADPVVFVDPTVNFSLTSLNVGLSIRGVMINSAIATPFAAYEAYDTYKDGGDLGAAVRSGALSFATSMAVGGAATQVLKYAPTLVNVTRRSAQQIIAARSSSSVWSLGWSARGFRIEQMVFGRSASINGAAQTNFRAIDDLTNGVASSIKSIDLTAATYRANPNAITSVIRRYARQLQAFNGATSGGIRVTSDQINQRALIVAFENGAANSAKAKVIASTLRSFKNEFPGMHIATAWIK